MCISPGSLRAELTALAENEKRKLARLPAGGGNVGLESLCGNINQFSSHGELNPRLINISTSHGHSEIQPIRSSGSNQPTPFQQGAVASLYLSEVFCARIVKMVICLWRIFVQGVISSLLILTLSKEAAGARLPGARRVHSSVLVPLCCRTYVPAARLLE